MSRFKGMPVWKAKVHFHLHLRVLPPSSSGGLGVRDAGSTGRVPRASGWGPSPGGSGSAASVDAMVLAPSRHLRFSPQCRAFVAEGPPQTGWRQVPTRGSGVYRHCPAQPPLGLSYRCLQRIVWSLTADREAERLHPNSADA